MTPMFADLLRARRQLRRHGRPLIIGLLNDLGTLWRPEAVHFSKPGSLRVETTPSEERSG